MIIKAGQMINYKGANLKRFERKNQRDSIYIISEKRDEISEKSVLLDIGTEKETNLLWTKVFESMESSQY